MALQVGDLGIDYSYGRPDLSKAKAAGAKFVVRYTAGVASLPSSSSYAANKGKLITPTEFKAILAAGLDIIANDEWYQSRMTEGAVAGTADAKAAAQVWTSCGLARGAAIIPSWDQDPAKSKWPAARAYLQAYAAEMSKHGYLVGVYAGTPFLKYASSSAFGRFVLRFLWRPNAGSWSNDGLPYQPDTSTLAKRAALVKLALTKTPANLWQTGNYWFNRTADEDMILRLPVGSHLEALAKDWFDMATAQDLKNAIAANNATLLKQFEDLLAQQAAVVMNGSEYKPFTKADHPGLFLGNSIKAAVAKLKLGGK